MSDNETLYAERSQRIADAVALKETDRVPFIYATRFWSAALAGISFEEAMYDVDKAVEATKAAIRLLQPDAFTPSIYAFGPTLEALDYKPMVWPGHGADANATFQYIDGEFMSAEEYGEYILDPTGFYLRSYLPRIAGAFEGLKHFPEMASLSEWPFIGAMSAFANPELQDSLKRLFAAGEQAALVGQRVGELIAEMKSEGFPIAAGGFCKAPYDHFLDFMRGSRGGMLDLFRHPEKLQAAMEVAGELMLRNVVEGAKRSGCPYVFIPLHWGLDGFMSAQQFKSVYWPGLYKIILHLIEHDTVPCILWEGDCTSRLELIGDIPPGKAIYWFEQTDLVRAKKILGDTVCLRGNLPAALLNTGTPDEVEAYCRELIEKVGRGGGFILDGAASITDEAPRDNVIAMAQSVEKYAL